MSNISPMFPISRYQKPLIKTYSHRWFRKKVWDVQNYGLSMAFNTLPRNIYEYDLIAIVDEDEKKIAVFKDRYGPIKSDLVPKASISEKDFTKLLLLST